MSESTEVSYALAEYLQLEPHQQAMIRALVYSQAGLLESLETFEMTEDLLNDNLDLWQPCGGCVPDGYCSDLEAAIRRKFYDFLAVARERALSTFEAKYCIRIRHSLKSIDMT